MTSRVIHGAGNSAGALLGVVALAACDAPLVAPDASPLPPDADPLCLEAEQRSDLAWIQDNVLTPSCARFSACHQGGARMAADLNLEPGRSHAALVGVDSVLFPDYKRVAPGDPARSYLMIILGDGDGPLPETGTMPWNSGLLCEPVRAAIARWIASGATP